MRGMPRVNLMWIVALASACAGGAQKEEAQPRDEVIRPIEELPEAYRELWRAFLDQSPDWEELRDAASEDPDQRVFLVTNLVRARIRAFAAGTLGQTEHPNTLLYMRTGNELVALGPVAAPAVGELLALGHGEGRIMASDLLLRMGNVGLDPLLVQLDRDDSVDARRRSADLLAQMPHGVDGKEEQVRNALIRHLDEDEDWMVRERSAFALARRGMRDETITDARKALCRALLDEDHDVRRQAGEGLVALKDLDCIPAVLNLLDRSSREADVSGLRLAQDVMLALTGETERRDARAWRRWWTEERAALIGR